MRPGTATLEAVVELLRALRADVAALRAEASDVLDVPAVCARYRLRDPRAARAIMRETGGAFTVARRLLVHRAALEALERERARSGEEGEGEGEGEEPPPRARAGRARARLPVDFWRAGRGGA